MEGQDHAVDQISELPCTLLTDILSFLPTEEAVQTCILSKRWRNVWTSLQVLKFDDRKLNKLGTSDEEYRECEAKFLKFVDGVLNHRQILPCDTFKLSWRGRNHNRVFEILGRVAECMPRVITIRVRSSGFFSFPSPIFTSMSVEEMSLSARDDNYFSCRGDRPKPKLINLPSLRKLELGYMKINDKFIRMILSGCPLLEEVIMNGCWLDAREISSNKLKRLAFNECFVDWQMQIFCPRVVSLRIKCRDRKGFIFKNMSSLVNADLHFQAVDLNAPGYSDYHNLKLVGGLSNVTNLSLSMVSYFDPDILLQGSSNSPPFNNLTSLTIIHSYSSYDWHLVDWFLQNSPNIKELTLQMRFPSKDSEQEFLRAYLIQR